MESGILLTNRTTGAQIWATYFPDKKRKSYELLFRNKNEEIWTKIGIIKDITKFKEIFTGGSNYE